MGRGPGSRVPAPLTRTTGTYGCGPHAGRLAGSTSGPAPAGTIRERRAKVWADEARRVHRSHTVRSSSDSSNGAGSFGPREELTHQQHKSHNYS
jgi:hypothetical protein